MHILHFMFMDTWLSSHTCIKYNKQIRDTYHSPVDSRMLRAFLSHRDVHEFASDSPASTSNWRKGGEMKTLQAFTLIILNIAAATALKLNDLL